MKDLLVLRTSGGAVKLTKDQRLAVLVLVAVFLFNVYRVMAVTSGG